MMNMKRNSEKCNNPKNEKMKGKNGTKVPFENIFFLVFLSR